MNSAIPMTKMVACLASHPENDNKAFTITLLNYNNLLPFTEDWCKVTIFYLIILTKYKFFLFNCIKRKRQDEIKQKKGVFLRHPFLAVPHCDSHGD